MARKGASDYAVSFDTESTNLSMPEILMNRLVDHVASTTTYSNRADFVTFAFRYFNEYTVDFLFDQIEKYGDDPKEFKIKMAQRSSELYESLESCVPDGAKKRYGEKITFSIPVGLENYIQMLNQQTWKYKSIQEYMRVAIAFYLQHDKDKRWKMQANEKFLGWDFGNTSYPGESNTILRYNQE